MYLKKIAGIAGIALFVAYFAPIVIKLKDIPLTIVMLSGIVLVTIDVWQSLTNSDD